MEYKCSVCGANKVDERNGICELCAIGQDPYASALNNSSHKHQARPMPTLGDTEKNNIQGSGRSRRILLNEATANTDPYGNVIPQDTLADNIQVYQAGQAPTTNSSVVTNATTSVRPAKSHQPVTAGIIKNITTDVIPNPFIAKWARAFFSGIPFALDNDVTSFQVFPDYSGSSVNTSGNTCDQVIMYGKVTAGTVSENNDVEVFGRRDSNNNIIAKVIRNVASGTTVTALRIIPAGVIRFITLLFFGGIFAFAAAGSAGNGTPEAAGKYAGGLVLIFILLLIAFLLLKISPRFMKWSAICIAASIIVAGYLFMPGFLSQVISIVLTVTVIYLGAKMLFKWL